MPNETSESPTTKASTEIVETRISSAETMKPASSFHSWFITCIASFSRNEAWIGNLLESFDRLSCRLLCVSCVELVKQLECPIEQSAKNSEGNARFASTTCFRS